MVKTPAKKKHRFFTAHELHISLMFIILTSFFSAVAFTYLIKVFGDTVREHSMLSFALVMLGYAAIVWLLTITFAHRFIGPFERLRYELGMVIAGDFKKRLTIRRHDDAYIRAFEDDVNRVIEVLEKDNRRSADMHRDLYSDFTKIISNMPDDDPRRKELASLQDKISVHLR